MPAPTTPEHVQGSNSPVEGVWETPPSARRPRTDWNPTAEELRGNPGEWQRIQENSKSAGLTFHIKTGRLTAFRPRGEFQSRSVKNKDGSYNIYARFVGTETYED